MPQMRPNYPFMTSQVNELFINPLVARYGYNNVIWPIVISKNGDIAFYIYEVNEICKINSKDDNRPESISNKFNYFVDYTTNPRLIIPPFEELKSFMAEDFECSYDYILKSEIFSSVDIDYLWYKTNRWRAIELTTVYMPLKSKEESERLVKMFSRRPSWQGTGGAHGIKKLIEASIDLSIEYYMVVVNSEKGVSNKLVTDGNAFWFPLNYENIDRILANNAPLNSNFGTFAELLQWL